MVGDKVVQLLLRLQANQAEANLKKFAATNDSVVSKINIAWLGAKAAFAGYAARMVMDAINFAGSIDSVQNAFKSLTESFGADGNKLLADMKSLSKGMISEVDLMKSANLAMVLTEGKAIESLPKLTEIAIAAARERGTSAQQMLDDLVTASGRLSVMILDNTGISSATASKLIDKYAASLGKTREQLTQSQKAQAFFNAVLVAGNDLTTRMDFSTLSLGEKIQMLGAKTSNFTNQALSDMRDVFGRLIRDAYRLVDALQRMYDFMKSFGKGPKIDPEIEYQNVLNAYNQELEVQKQLNAEIEKRKKLSGIEGAYGDLAFQLNESIVRSTQLKKQLDAIDKQLNSIGKKKIVSGVKEAPTLGKKLGYTYDDVLKEFFGFTEDDFNKALQELSIDVDKLQKRMKAVGMPEWMQIEAMEAYNKRIEKIIDEQRKKKYEKDIKDTKDTTDAQIQAINTVGKIAKASQEKNISGLMTSISSLGQQIAKQVQSVALATGAMYLGVAGALWGLFSSLNDNTQNELEQQRQKEEALLKLEEERKEAVQARKDYEREINSALIEQKDIQLGIIHELESSKPIYDTAAEAQAQKDITQSTLDQLLQNAGLDISTDKVGVLQAKSATVSDIESLKGAKAKSQERAAEIARLENEIVFYAHYFSTHHDKKWLKIIKELQDAQKLQKDALDALGGTPEEIQSQIDDAEDKKVLLDQILDTMGDISDLNEKIDELTEEELDNLLEKYETELRILDLQKDLGDITADYWKAEKLRIFNEMLAALDSEKDKEEYLKIRKRIMDLDKDIADQNRSMAANLQLTPARQPGFVDIAYRSIRNISGDNFVQAAKRDLEGLTMPDGMVNVSHSLNSVRGKSIQEESRDFLAELVPLTKEQNGILREILNRGGGAIDQIAFESWFDSLRLASEKRTQGVAI